MDMKIGKHVLGTPSLGVIDHNTPTNDEKKVVQDDKHQSNDSADQTKTTDADRTTV